MQQFLVLLYADETAFEKLSPEEMKAALAGFARYNEELAKSGVLKHGEQVMPSKLTKTLSMERGKVKTVDGPFIESKEQMGGYYVLEVESEAQAIEWAQKCPIIYSGSIEVRKLIPRPETEG